MSDILSAISDDIEEYEDLCQQFGEQVQRSDDGSPDCYGSHAKILKKRAKEAEETIRIATLNRSPEMRAMCTMLVALLGRLENKGLARMIKTDPVLHAWWKHNRKKYYAGKAERAAELQRQHLATHAKRKLSPRERNALGVS